MSLEDDNIEIERKFLLSDLPPKVVEFPSYTILQGWIKTSTEGQIKERVQFYDRHQQNRFKRGIKIGSGISRIEIEDKITQEDFKAFWPLTIGSRILKKRYEIPEGDGDLVWEIDNFQDRQLFIAEVELPTEDTPVEIPEWMKTFVIKEVTGIKEYEGAGLGR